MALIVCHCTTAKYVCNHNCGNGESVLRKRGGQPFYNAFYGAIL